MIKTTTSRIGPGNSAKPLFPPNRAWWIDTLRYPPLLLITLAVNKSLLWLPIKGISEQGTESRRADEWSWQITWALLDLFCARTPEWEHQRAPGVSVRQRGPDFDPVLRRLAEYPEETDLLCRIAGKSARTQDDFFLAVMTLQKLRRPRRGHPSRPDWQTILRVLTIEAIRFIALMPLRDAIICFNTNAANFAAYEPVDTQYDLRISALDGRASVDKDAYQRDRRRVKAYANRMGIRESTLLPIPQPYGWHRYHTRACERQWEESAKAQPFRLRDSGPGELPLVERVPDYPPDDHSDPCSPDPSHTWACEVTWEALGGIGDPSHEGMCLNWIGPSLRAEGLAFENRLRHLREMALAGQKVVT